MTTCLPAIKACRARIVRVDACGRPVPGPKSVISFKGFVSITRSPDYEEGEEFLQKNACGDLCINEKDCDRLKRINMDIQFCTIDPDIVEMTTGNRLLLDPLGDAKGWATGEEVQCEGGFSLEIWQKTAGGVCAQTGAPLWHYWAWPFITNGTLGDMTFENGPFVFNVSGHTRRIQIEDQWGPDNRGPFLVLPPSAQMVTGDHEAKWLTEIQPPEDVCGAQTYDLPVDVVAIDERSNVEDTPIVPFTPAVITVPPGEPVTWAASGLPSGLTIDPNTGTISGTPTVPGVYDVRVTAIKADGSSDTEFFQWEITAVPFVVTVNDPGAQNFPQDLAITPVQMTATVAPPFAPGQALVWSATGLPFGLVIDPDTGEITGIPLDPGNSTSTIRATAPDGNFDDQVVQWTITA